MKYVAAETVFDYSLPTSGQTICTILKPLGNNTHRVRTPEGEEFIVSMPPKFRRHVYVKRGSFVVTEPIVEGKKVKAEIVRILQRPQIKYFNEKGAWPEVFSQTVYLENNHVLSENTSDRGFVHGGNILLIDHPTTSTASDSSATNPSSSSAHSNNILLIDPTKSEASDSSAVNASSSSVHSNELCNESVRNESSNSSRSVAISIESSTFEAPESFLNINDDDETTDSDTDDESDLVPNFNRKAVSRYVFSDDSDCSSDEDGSDSSSDESETSDDTTDDNVKKEPLQRYTHKV